MEDPKEMPQYTSRAEVQEDLQRLIEKFPEGSNDPVLTRRLLPSLAYLNQIRVLEKELPKEKKIPFERYLEIAGGYPEVPYAFTEEQYEAVKLNLKSSLIEAEKLTGTKIPLNKNTNTTLKTLAGHVKIEEFSEMMVDTMKRNLKFLSDLTGISKDDLNKSLAGVSIDITDGMDYTAWIHYDKDDPINGIKLEINSERMSKNENGEPIISRAFWIYIAQHEFCGHAVQRAALKRRIEDGEIPLSMGLIGMYMPDMTHAEGLALSVHDILPEDDRLPKPILNAIVNSAQLIRMATCDVSCGLASGHMSEGEAVQLFEKYTLQTKEQAKVSVKEAKNYLANSPYAASYSPAYAWGRSCIGPMFKSGNIDAIKSIYNSDLSPKELLELAHAHGIDTSQVSFRESFSHNFTS